MLQGIYRVDLAVGIGLHVVLARAGKSFCLHSHQRRCLHACELPHSCLLIGSEACSLCERWYTQYTAYIQYTVCSTHTVCSIHTVCSMQHTYDN